MLTRPSVSLEGITTPTLKPTTPEDITKPETIKTLPPVTVPIKVPETYVEKVTLTEKITEKVTQIEKVTQTATPVTVEKNNTLRFTETAKVVKPTTIESVETKEISKITTEVVVVTKVVPTG